MGKVEWEVRLLGMEELSDGALESFDRFQLTKRVRVRKQDGHVTRDTHFTDDWDEKGKMEVVKSLRKCLEQGGSVSGAFREGRLLGFASVESGFFGSDRSYLQLSSLHISREARHQGLGKRLFRICCEEARRMGAGKLYISSHSSEETQRFYESVGCVDAKEINPVLLAREPFDIQLEFDLEKEL